MDCLSTRPLDGSVVGGMVCCVWGVLASDDEEPVERWASALSTARNKLVAGTSPPDSSTPVTMDEGLSSARMRWRMACASWAGVSRSRRIKASLSDEVRDSSAYLRFNAVMRSSSGSVM